MKGFGKEVVQFHLDGYKLSVLLTFPCVKEKKAIFPANIII